MTHTESQDLLLDLAYGELPAHVAAEVTQHLEGCAECQAGQAQLSGVRSAFAPIRELEEPSQGFDDRILAAARAEALLEHDGNIGQVIEGAGSFAPPALAASSIDAHASAAPAAPSRRRPKWMMRAVLGGSAATAAALALMIGVSRPTRLHERASEEEFAIRVKPQVPVTAEAPRATGAVRDATPSAVEAPAGDNKLAQAPALQPAAPRPPLEVLALRNKGPTIRRAEQKKKASEPAIDQGSGGDLPAQQEIALAGKALEKQSTDSLAAAASASPPADKEVQPPVQLDAQNVVVTGSSVRRRDGAKDEAPSAGAPNSFAYAPAKPAAPGVAESGNTADAAYGVGAEGDLRRAIPETPPPPAKAATAARAAKAAVPPPQDPIDLEHRAEAARHDGDYATAAGLYREAASGHNYNSSAAAWDLAHAVECLAASGSFEEARRVRDQLGRVFPTEIAAFAAARRALREVDSNPSK